MIDLRLDKESPVPFYRQIVDMVLAGISAGRIAPGERLPTIRDLAVKLQVNPNTVVKAYWQLQMLGVLDSQQGSGAFVRAVEPSEALSPAQRKKALESLCRDFVGRAQLLNIDIKQLIGQLRTMRSEGKHPPAGKGKSHV